MLHEQFRDALAALDVAMVRELWLHVHPNMPQPTSDDEALKRIHYARTLIPSIPFKDRAYSHCWLNERLLPSGLPDWLKPRAQRMYPKVVSAVGISVNGKSPMARAMAPHVLKVMTDAVQDAYAHGEPEPSFVKKRMIEARDKEIRKLVGKVR